MLVALEGKNNVSNLVNDDKIVFDTRIVSSFNTHGDMVSNATHLHSIEDM